MFSITRYCLAQEDPGNYSVSTVRRTGIEAEQKSMPLWSFRPCQISIKEAVEKGIRLDPTPQSIRARKVMLSIGPHSIDPDDPRLNLFNILGPKNNPFTDERDLVSILLANDESDLDIYAKECWRHLDIFGSSTNLVRALQKLEKEKIGSEVKGDFLRLKAALKIILPEEDLKGRKQSDLSRFLEDFCNQIASGIRKEPEVSEDLIYCIIRLNYGSERGQHSTVAFRHQFSNTTIPIKALNGDRLAAGAAVQEETVLLPKYQTGQRLNYKNICIYDKHDQSTGKKTFIVRVMPREPETDLEITLGGTKENGTYNILQDFEVKKLLHRNNIPWTEDIPEPDGTKRSSRRKRILVDLSQLTSKDCHSTTLDVLEVSPKVLSPRVLKIVSTTPVVKSYATLSLGRSQWLTCSLRAGMPGVTVLTGLPDTDTVIIHSLFDVQGTTPASKRSALRAKAREAWNTTLEILPKEFAKLFRSGIALISPRLGEGKDGKMAEQTFDVITPPLGRYGLSPYISGERGIEQFHPPRINSLPDNETTSLQRALKEAGWDSPWQNTSRVYLKPQKDQKVDVVFLPTREPPSANKAPLGPKWPGPTPPISPLIALYIGLGKALAKMEILSVPSCPCGVVTTMDEWDQIGAHGGKQAYCRTCDLHTSILIHLLAAFVQDRTVRGSYLEWWKEGKDYLDMKALVGSMFQENSGFSSNLRKDLRLVYHRRAIINEPELRQYCGKDSADDQRSAIQIGF